MSHAAELSPDTMTKRSRLEVFGGLLLNKGGCSWGQRPNTQEMPLPTLWGAGRHAGWPTFKAEEGTGGGGTESPLTRGRRRDSRPGRSFRSRLGSSEQRSAGHYPWLWKWRPRSLASSTTAFPAGAAEVWGGRPRTAVASLSTERGARGGGWVTNREDESSRHDTPQSVGACTVGAPHSPARDERTRELGGAGPGRRPRPRPRRRPRHRRTLHPCTARGGNVLPSVCTSSRV